MKKQQNKQKKKKLKQQEQKALGWGKVSGLTSGYLVKKPGSVVRHCH